MVVTTLLGYFILLVFFYAERRLQRADAVRSSEAAEFNRHTTRYLGLAYGISILALLLSWVLNALDIAPFPYWVAWVGVLVAFAGLLVRTWANRVLGRFHARSLRVPDGPKIVQDGPYRIIRHPGYLGMILLWIGVSMATGNWIVTAIAVVVICAAYYYRIHHEERLLLGNLPGYAEYRARTWRLIPLIY